jgi:hypothetical protein
MISSGSHFMYEYDVIDIALITKNIITNDTKKFHKYRCACYTLRL